MSQLTGPEQATLVSLLVEPVESVKKLDNAMHHAGLGRVSDHSAESEALPEVVSSIVRAFSNQYHILELVHAILNYPSGLNGSCPPIKNWLKDVGSGLDDRKRQNPIQPRNSGQIHSHPLPKWASLTLFIVVLTLIIVVLVIVVISLLHLFRPPVETKPPPVLLNADPQLELFSPISSVKIERDRQFAIQNSEFYKLRPDEFIFFSYRIVTTNGRFPKRIKLKLAWQNQAKIGVAWTEGDSWYVDRVAESCDIPDNVIDPPFKAILVFIPYNHEVLTAVERQPPLDFIEFE